MTNALNLVLNFPPKLTAADISKDATRLVVDMDCDTSLSVGDLVRLDPTIDNKVVKATDNLTAAPVIGVVQTKTTPTTARIILRGVVDRTVPRGRVFLGPTGDFTTTNPTSGYQQILGYSFGNGQLNFDPNQIVTRIS